MEIKYSFIVPHHNSPVLLNRLLKSIPKRDDIEIIIVDDNSKPNLVPIIERSNVKLIYIDKQNSKGAGHARNIGLEQAKGKWLLFADCDDFYEEDFLLHLDRALSDNPDILLFNAYFQFNIEDGICKDDDKYTKIIKRYIGSKKNTRDIRRLLMSYNEPWNKVYSTAYIKKYNLKFEEIPKGNDAWFVLNAGFFASKVSVLNEKLYYYVFSNNGITWAPRTIKQMKPGMLSNIRQNKLKAKAGLWDLINIYSVNKNRYIKEFGYMEFYKWMFYKLFHDYTLIPAIIFSLYKKIFFVK